MANRDNPGIYFPPPLIFALGVVLGLAVDRLLGWSLGLSATIRYGLGLGLLVASSVPLLLALGLFRRFGTRPEPWRETTAIVATGIYRYTRNPMYLGMGLAHAGVAIASDSLAALLLLPLVVIVIDRWVIRREERYLQAKFGEDYLAYMNRVRRWL